MLSEPQALEAKARELAAAVAARPEAARALRLADRLAAGRFVVAVVGECKRGKATLLNALAADRVGRRGVLTAGVALFALAYVVVAFDSLTIVVLALLATAGDIVLATEHLGTAP